MFKHYLLALLLAVSCYPAFSAKFYVAPTGNDANSGTIQQPFLTIQRAQTAVVAGDTVWVRGGTYLMQNSQIAAYFATGNYAYITQLSKSGSATAGRINYWAYPGERPVFNYANVDPHFTNPGAPLSAPYRLSAFEITGSYIHIRGLEIVGLRVPLVGTATNTLSICVSQSGAGGNNIYERLSMHDGQAIGFYLTRGGNTLVLNCDAYRNNDNVNNSNTTGTANGGNVDGFGSHPNNATYTGIVFRGCRAWQNSDDGYDCISAFTATTFENCWAFYNGYTQNFTTRGDGNGFKAGGYGSTALTGIPATVPSNTIRFCVSVRNRSNGFYSNHHLEGSTWLNNTAYQNAVNYDMLNRQARTTAGYLVDVPGYRHTLRNNISLLPRSTNAATRDLNNHDATPGANTTDHNTFLNASVTVDASDFVSLDTTLLRAPRQADGSLPVTSLLRLAPSSDLIDAGIDVGFPYSGPAPDLGAYEFAAVSIWTGAASTDWFDAANWTAGVPTAATDALIPVVSSGRYPSLGGSSATVRNLTLASGATLSQGAGTLSLTGDLTNNGTLAATTGSMTTSGSTNQLLGGSGTYSFQNLTIGPAGATLGTAASVRRVLSLTGNLATNSQALTLLSSVTSGQTTDALVVNNGGVVTGAATVQRAIDPSSNAGLGYRHYAAPVSNTTVGDLSTGGTFTPVLNSAYNSSATPNQVTPFPTVYGYDDSRVALTNNLSGFDKGFFSPTALSDALAPGRGYTVNIAANELVDFQGTLTNGDVPLALTSTRASYPSSGGWQLLGNPYPAPLNYALVVAGDRTGLEDAIYVYSSTSQYAGQYRSYVNGVGNPVLPMGQGFFARVAAGQSAATLTFRNSQRLTAPSSTAFQRTTAETRPLVQLTLQGAGSSLLDEATVYFEQGATSSFDLAYDAEKLSNPTGLNLATSLANGRNMSINGQPELGLSQRIVPLTIGVPTAGTYIFTASQLLNLSAVPVYLHDRQLGTLTDLRQQPSYSFTVANAATLHTTRFELVFSPQRALATVSATLAQQVTVYPNPASKQVAIELPLSLSRQPITAVLVDALGRVVLTHTLPAGAGAHALPLANVGTGVYSLRLTTEAGTVVKKLVVE